MIEKKDKPTSEIVLGHRKVKLYVPRQEISFAVKDRKMKTKFIFILLAAVLATIVQPVFPETAWFNLLVNEQKVGYYSFDRRTEHDGRQKFIIQEEESLIKFKRNNDIASIKTGSLLEMDETGRPLHFKCRTVQAGSDYEIEGRLDYTIGRAKIVHKRRAANKEDGQQQTGEINIPGNSLTDYQALLRLKEKGWQKGDTITYPNLMIENGIYVNVTMSLVEIESPGTGKPGDNLYEVMRSIETLPGVQSITWVDSELLPHKGRLIFPHTAYSLVKVSKEEALRSLDEKPVLFEPARIHLTSSLSMDDIEKNRRKVKSILLHIQLENGDKLNHDLSGGCQSIIEGDLAKGLKIAIHTEIPGEKRNIPIAAYSLEMQPYLSPNRLIESDNDKIKILAEQLKINSSVWDTSICIKNWVHENIGVDFKTGMSSALEVLNAKSGDCTEHAILTTALCRACGIPTRVALGYILSFDRNQEPIFVGHLWNEVFIDGNWYPIDSTGSDEIPNPFRLRIFSSSLLEQDIMNKIAQFALTRDMKIALISVSPGIGAD